MTLVAGVDSSTQSCKVVVRDLETGLAARPSGNLAELRLKIALLSLDGQLRPEFEAGVLADAMRLLAAREKG